MSNTYRSEVEPGQIDIPRETSTPAFSPNLGAIVALFALYIIWGSTYLGMRIAIQTIPPFLLSGIRFLIAGACLYVFLRARHVPAPTRKQWFGAGVLGILLLVLGNGLVSFSEQWVASGLAAVAVGAVPLWTAFFVGLLGRWPSRIEWSGLGLGFVGLLLLNLEHGMWANPLGALCLVVAPICWALGSALNTRLSLPSNGLMSSAAEMLVGGVILLALGFGSGERLNAMPSWSSLSATLYLIVFGSLVAFCAYGYLLRNVRSTLATSYAYVNPMVAVGLGVVLAGEHITWLGVVAMLVILTGVGLVSLGRQRK